MLWSDFYDNFWDWSDSTRKSRISSLEDIGSGSEVVDVIYEIEDQKIRAQMIRKAIKLGAIFTSEDFQNLEGELPDEVYEQLGQHAGFHAAFPSYDKDDTSWSHYYDNFTEWSPELQSAAIQKLSQLGSHDEIVDAILSMDGMGQRVSLLQKAMSRGVKFDHDDFMNLWDMLPQDVYLALAAHTGYSAECPDYDKDDHSWQFFYDNGGAWTEDLQLKAIASLTDIGDAEQITEMVMNLTEQKPKAKLIERAIAEKVIFSRDNLTYLDGDIPDHLFQKLLVIAGIPEDSLYFDEDTITEDTFADEIELGPELSAPESAHAANKNAKGFLNVLGIIAAAIFGIFFIFIKVIIEITKPYYGGKHHRSSYRSFGKHVKKKNSNRCDGDCDNCPAHYGYRYGRWYYGHGHQHGCLRGGNGGRTGRTYRD